ncbi:ATP-binding cassette domain-containing protein [Methanoculleus sp. Wushi-C6]|uniref:Molybdate/tungstate import ATP-binding protein WtpC n=1 Tax=Methanoculleus caldifontis TaxID=2651577 RepID=A0ABU3WXD8_9EURY|nr:ATP-binding cassette domain-containing protein [Methanoculleus sp. Wushi-C6]MDV2480462.1 ATP-binding cassette domain-containing protein [Methanoculleus sp. Wushi-C6]
MIAFDRVSLNLGSFRLKDVSLTIGKGDYYFVVGPSGAGKTVLLEAIAGLHSPEHGRVLLRGEEITALPPERRGVALVYQDYSLFPNMTVSDNVSYGLRVRGMRKAEARSGVAGLLERFGIAHLADRYPGTLSGGEQQRVALARAVAVKPDILLLDEPLSALDPVTQEKFIEDLRRLHREEGLTIVQVSHSRREAHLLATRVAVIIDGALVDEGEAGVVLNAPKSREVASFVGVENILDGRVTANEDGLATVDAGGRTFEAVTEAAAGEKITLCIRADDVVIAVGGERRSSARNTMAGTVVSVAENGPVAEVKVDSGVVLTAVLTRRSVRDLALAPGTPVTLSVKATAIHVIRG